MVEAMPDWYVVLVCGGLAVLLGLSVLLCAMTWMIVVMLPLDC